MVLQLGSSCRQKRAEIYCKTLPILSKAPGSPARGGLEGPHSWVSRCLWTSPTPGRTAAGLAEQWLQVWVWQW